MRTAGTLLTASTPIADGTSSLNPLPPHPLISLFPRTPDSVPSHLPLYPSPLALHTSSIYQPLTNLVLTTYSRPLRRPHQRPPRVQRPQPQKVLRPRVRTVQIIGYQASVCVPWAEGKL